MNYRIKRKIKKFTKGFLEFLKEIEPVLRLVEVGFVIWGTIYVSTKANHIAEMQLEIDKANIQPVFEITEEITSNSKGEENANSVVTISNTSGTCSNIEISTACFITVYYFQDVIGLEKNIKLKDFYYTKIMSGNSQGEICTMVGENNWKKYYEMFSQCLTSKEIDTGYLKLSKYIKVTYKDEINDMHTKYYEVDSITTKSIDEEFGRMVFEKYQNLDSELHVDELSVEKLLEIIK